MQHLAVYSFLISILSLIASGTVATVQFRNFRKDNPIIEASSKIVKKSFMNREDEKVEIPVLKIKVTNSGKRPVQLLYLIKVFRKGKNREESKTILNDYPKGKEWTSLDNEFRDLIMGTLRYDSNEQYPMLMVDEKGEEIIKKYSELASERDKEHNEWANRAQNHALYLEAGKIFEKEFELFGDDCYAFLYDIGIGELATELMIEDIFGKKYKVKNSRQCIAKLTDYRQSKNKLE